MPADFPIPATLITPNAFSRKIREGLCLSLFPRFLKNPSMHR